MWTIPIAFLTTAADLRLKDGIENLPKENLPQPLGDGFITLDRLHNPGFLFGKNAEYPYLNRAVISLAFVHFLFRYLKALSKPAGLLHRLGLALVTGGAASNLIDRYRRGYVVDYLRFSPKQIHHIVMNLGDIAVFLGMILTIGTIKEEIS